MELERFFFYLLRPAVGPRRSCTASREGRTGNTRKEILFSTPPGIFWGTTSAGGLQGYCYSNSCGTVYRLSPTSSGWEHTVLYSFTGLADGGEPNPGLASDAAGDLYGTTCSGATSSCYGARAPTESFPGRLESSIPLGTSTEPPMRVELMDSELCTNSRRSASTMQKFCPKNHKAGLVGPAVLSWNWFDRSCFDRRPRMSKSLKPTAAVFLRQPENSSLNLRRGVTGPRCVRNSYITIARFSNSCCRTGRAHPAISTRPAASSAALGETP
jgi:uncharacterized repeat protein (TIGR03803 family)